MQILKEKFENEREIRKREVELKKKEQEDKAAQHQMLIDQQRWNQQQCQGVLIIAESWQNGSTGRNSSSKTSLAFPVTTTTVKYSWVCW